MTVSPWRSLRRVLESGVTVDALLSLAAPDARFHSALTAWDGSTREQAIALVAAETAAVEGSTIVDSFEDDTHDGLVLTGTVDGEPILQILLATFDAEGRIGELKSFFKFMLPFTALREKVRQSLPELPEEVWRVRELAPDRGEFHPSRPTFRYSPELNFNSPVLRKGVAPEPLATKVLSHASSIYGIRNWTDFGMEHDGRRLAFFEVDIDGQPLTVANILTFVDGRLVEIVAAGRPWASSLALYSRVKNRLGEELGDEFFWAAQPDYEAYL